MSSNILDLKEQLQTNLSGPKIDFILNYLLLNSLNPLCYNTKIPQQSISSILVQYTRDQRRKISHVPREKVVDYLFNAVVGNRRNFLMYIRKAKLERGIVNHIIKHIYDKLKHYDENLSFKKQSQYATRDIRYIGIKENNKRLGAAIRWSKYYYDEYIKFKNMIIEKYIRFAHNESQKAAKQTSLQVDVDDLFENCLLGVSKAIDRYDPDRGPLTACVRGWLQDAKTGAEFSHNYGHSYEVPTEKRKELGNLLGKNQQISFSEQLEDNEEAEEIEEHGIDITYFRERENQEFLDFINRTHKTKLARLYYGVPYVLSEQEKQMLKDTVK